MSLSTKISGSWKDISEVHTKVGGSWKAVSEVWTKVSGVWKQVYQFLTVEVFGDFTGVAAGGFGNYKDRASLSIVTAPTGQTITAYQWHYSDFNGYINQVSPTTTGATLILDGPTYDPLNFNSNGLVNVYCDVTIGGNVYSTPEVALSYTIDGAG